MHSSELNLYSIRVSPTYNTKFVFSWFDLISMKKFMNSSGQRIDS